MPTKTMTSRTDAAHAAFQAAWNARREAQTARAQADYESRAARAVAVDVDAELVAILQRTAR